MKKIMFLMYSLECGGAQSVLINLVNHLPKDKVDVTVCTLFGGEDLENRLNKDIHLKSIFRVKNQKIKKILSGLFQYLAPQGLVYKTWYKGDYDCEVAYMEGYPVKVLSKSKNPHKIAWTHIDVEAYTRQDHLFKSLTAQKKAYDGFDKIICVSECVKDSFVRKFGFEEKTDVIYNLIDAETIREKGMETNPYQVNDTNAYHFVTVGNIIPRKRLERLVYIAEYIKANRPNIPFYIHIIGKGEETGLRDLIDKKCLKDVILFEGYHGNPYPWIAHAAGYLCTSEVEGYSTSIAEAMVLGIPVISTKSAGTVEVMGIEKGFNLISQDNETEGIIVKRFSEAMILLMTDGDLREKLERESAKRGKDFSTEQAVENVMALFS